MVTRQLQQPPVARPELTEAANEVYRGMSPAGKLAVELHYGLTGYCLLSETELATIGRLIGRTPERTRQLLATFKRRCKAAQVLVAPSDE